MRLVAEPNDIVREIPDERIEKYIVITQGSLERLNILPEAGTELRAKAEEFLEMAEAYYKDALHFMDNGDIVNAYGCINYSQGWIDAGVRIGLFRIEKK
jgi:hypothetical protein